MGWRPYSVAIVKQREAILCVKELRGKGDINIRRIR